MPALQAQAHTLTETSHTPTTSESAHQADNHSGNWVQPKPSSPTAHHFLGYQLPNPEALQRGEGNVPQTYSKPSYIENTISVGEEVLLPNLPRGLAAGEEPAAGDSLPLSFLNLEVPEALARFQLVTPKPRAILACA